MELNLIVRSKIKSAVPDMNVATEVADALNKKAILLLKEAAERAKLNGRRTIQARDI